MQARRLNTSFGAPSTSHPDHFIDFDLAELRSLVGPSSFRDGWTRRKAGTIQISQTLVGTINQEQKRRAHHGQAELANGPGAAVPV